MANKFVLVVFVPVAFTHVRFVTPKLLVTVPFVATNVSVKKLLLVALTLVTFPRTAFHRFVDDPRAYARSSDGIKSELNRPLTVIKSADASPRDVFPAIERFPAIVLFAVVELIEK